ncbi:PD-(D/E)XK nuclease family protein [Oribacterium sp. oral taxon 102]|uniref:PD-(D/E)XK nuclease family protein n=1 Tax=Oribacterium sp. oral taxon 102 TaxID=671214 RepID=UPI0015C0D084|nr:PD-(D/E)XK nuclease family protein [Oribacterium sp. oral taxon 102]NWO22128.1 PD-(D/E)XK nuclease family protein [Oribacterium sp. oral taxon 102]
MSIRFLFGISGSGKTEYMIRRALREAPRDLRRQWLFLVPEQDTLSMQRRVAGHPENPGKGMLNIDVLSFRRLAYRVFRELNQEPPRIIDDSGKVMILRETAEKVCGELSYYREQLNRPGFLRELKSQISEFYQYRILPEMLDMAAERSGSVQTKSKLRDLALLYRAFREYMDSHGYLAQEELLDRLLQALPLSKQLRNSTLFFDGFTGFTPVQQDIIEELMLQSSELCFALDLRAEETASIYEKRGAEDLFYLTRETVQRLSFRAARQRIPVAPPIDLNRYQAETGEPQGASPVFPRFSAAPELQYLAEQIYRYGEPEQEAPPASSIELWEAGDIRSELEHAAEQIEHAVREEGKRYAEIGILLTVPEEYRDLLFRVFGAAEIPYFLDDSRSLLDSPYAELIRAALLVPERSFSFDSVIRYLRALPLRSEEEENEIDLFENYLRESGKRGLGKYREDWEAYPLLKEKLIGPLLLLQEESGRGSTAAERTEALRALLERIGARERVEAAAEEKRQAGEQELAEELLQGMARITELLERLALLLGDTAVSRREYIDILDSGLREEKLHIIPTTVDQVMIGDLTRSRFSNPSVFMILGASAANLPKAAGTSGILGDRERALFRELEMELAPDRTEDALLERFYIYRALAAPSQRLLLSYATKGRGGKGLRRSSVMEKIEQLFPNIRMQSVRKKQMELYTGRELLRQLSRRLPDYLEDRRAEKPASETEETLLRTLLLLRRNGYRAESAGLLSAAFTHYRESKLERSAAEAVYGERLRGSITRIEQFNQCAYAHFLRYGLRLSERKTDEIQAFDIGNLYHRAIELAFREAERQKRGLGELSAAELHMLSEQVVLQTAEENRDLRLLSTGRNRYILRKIGEITRTTLWALSEQLRRGDFRTIALERDFDLLRDGIELRGRIDRVDSCRSGDRLYVRVIDYKSGRTAFSLQKVYEGLQIQLVTYMNVMLQNLAYRNPGREVLPAGLFYYHIDSPVLDYQEGKREEELLRERLQALRMDGLVNAELDIVRHMDRDFTKDSDVIPATLRDGLVDERKKSAASTERLTALRHYVDRRIGRDARRILEGEIAVRPVREDKERTACSYCPYHSVCAFDPRVEGYRYRNIGKISEEELWKRLSEEEEKDGDDVD